MPSTARAGSMADTRPAAASASHRWTAVSCAMRRWTKATSFCGAHVHTVVVGSAGGEHGVETFDTVAVPRHEVVVGRSVEPVGADLVGIGRLLLDHAAPEVVDLTRVPHEVGDPPARARRHLGVQPGALGGVGEGLAVAPDGIEVRVGRQWHLLIPSGWWSVCRSGPRSAP